MLKAIDFNVFLRVADHLIGSSSHGHGLLEMRYFSKNGIFFLYINTIIRLANSNTLTFSRRMLKTYRVDSEASERYVGQTSRSNYGK